MPSIARCQDTPSPQKAVTRTYRVDAVLWYRIVDPAKAIAAIADYRSAVHHLALTSLRNIIGQHVLDEVLKERDSINQTLGAIVDGVPDRSYNWSYGNPSLSPPAPRHHPQPSLPSAPYPLLRLGQSRAWSDEGVAQKGVDSKR